jgi:UDP-N-acetylglucosamine transferase subunit ALG13
MVINELVQFVGGNKIEDEVREVVQEVQRRVLVTFGRSSYKESGLRAQSKRNHQHTLIGCC